MSKKARILQQKLDAFEKEFHALLVPCLLECSRGRYGLFRQNSHLDPEDRFWRWPEAKHLRELAYEIHSARLKAGELNPVCEKFIGLCEMKGPNVAGEPQLATSMLETCEGKLGTGGEKIEV